MKKARRIKHKSLPLSVSPLIFETKQNKTKQKAKEMLLSSREMRTKDMRDKIHTCSVDKAISISNEKNPWIAKTEYKINQDFI